MSRASCSKLTMSLVNDSLKFQTAILHESVSRASCSKLTLLLVNDSLKFQTEILHESMSRASCSKLTMSLVNDLLKFQTAILQIHCYIFLLKKCENPDSHILSTKSNNVFAYGVSIYLS